MTAYTKIHTGPVRSSQDWIRAGVERAGFTVRLIGTEHLYADLPLDPDGWGIIPAIAKIEGILFNDDGRFLDARVIREEN